MRTLASGAALPLILRLVREEGRRHLRSYGLALACMLLVALTTALSAYLMKNVINDVFVARSTNAMVTLSIVIVVIYAVKGVAGYGQMVILSRISNAIVASNQLKLFAKYLSFDLATVTGTHSGELVNRFQTGATSIATALQLLVTSIGRDLFTLLGLVAVMIVQDTAMAVAALVIAPAAVIGIRLLVRRVKKVRLRAYGIAGELLQTLQEALQGIRVIKAYRMERAFVERMAHVTDDARQSADKMAAIAARTSPLMETLGGFAIAAVIVYGGYRVIHSGQTPGEFFSFIAALLLAYEPAKRLARLNLDLQTALLGVQLHFDTLDSIAGEAERPGKRVLTVERGEIVFDHVTFGYDPAEPVVRDLCLTLEGGRTTALVGESGSGKSTLVALIQYLYTPQQGGILIDGQEVRSVTLDSLRGQIAVVGQDTFLFNGTVRDNIAIGRPDASDTEIEAAAIAANADGFIRALPQGYLTPVGERGASLSGGQRQRIAIARAILKDAPIILLDEATAALDNESEREVQQALRVLAADRTTLVIAHRLNTVRDADVIHVMDGGRVVESGTHMALLSTGGRYRALYEVMSQKDR
ncbi:MAG: ABC transporter ATP-binding protein [Labrys sp. (in: a-proteobacteria)]